MKHNNVPSIAEKADPLAVSKVLQYYVAKKIKKTVV